MRMSPEQLQKVLKKDGYAVDDAPAAAPAPVRAAPVNRAKQAIEEVVVAGVPAPEAEHRFHPTRRWRFDMAWPERMVAVEIEGGVAAKGHGHFSREGYAKDCEKYNAAALMGWTVLRFTTDMVSRGEHVATLVELIGVE